MKKIPTLFVREYEERANGKGKRIVGCKNELTNPEFEEIFEGDYTKYLFTVKRDGSACAVINGKFYKRFDAKGSKRRKKLEALGDKAIKCQEHHDPITGSFPCWVPVDENEPSDKWFIEAYNAYKAWNDGIVEDGTYEAIGKHFNSNPYKMDYDVIEPHGKYHAYIDKAILSYNMIKEWLHNVEE